MSLYLVTQNKGMIGESQSPCAFVEAFGVDVEAYGVNVKEASAKTKS